MDEARTTGDDRESARSALVAALLTLRAHPAEDAFEALVESTVESGSVDPMALRELRWWHRASQDELRRHVEVLLPGVWALIDEGNKERELEFARDRAAWELAAGLAAGRPEASTAGTPTTSVTPVTQDDVDAAPASSLEVSAAAFADSAGLGGDQSDPSSGAATPTPSAGIAASAEVPPDSETGESDAADDMSLTLAAVRRRRERYELRRTEPRPHPASGSDSTTPSGVPTNRRLVVGLTVLSGD